MTTDQPRGDRYPIGAPGDLRVMIRTTIISASESVAGTREPWLERVTDAVRDVARAGADDTPRTEGADLTPGQLLALIIDSDPEPRILYAQRILENDAIARAFDPNNFRQSLQLMEAANTAITDLTGKVETVRAIHRPVEFAGRTICEHCLQLYQGNDRSDWPCPTATALGDDPDASL
ncbi:MAG: hypothetical protein L6R40_001378 [Gallowayella cf. fulva]|nr:MAG: hypothetical protein L6R40_001378 [Xanthomendoza cf. fulva]